MTDTKITGGCLCGALRYAASVAPLYMGYCCCADCRKASGSGFIGFLGFAPGAVKVTGEAVGHFLPHEDGRTAQRYRCASCGGLVIGGEPNGATGNNVYAGSLDDPTVFKPTMAIFVRDKPDWVILPPGLTLFEGMPK
jgi:hypothetical protein